MPLPDIPAELALAISDRTGGRVAVVTGAGCSKEPPTSLPLARELSERIHKSLVDHGVIPPGSCPDPSDLSVLADTVINESDVQRPLVDQFPPEDFRQAAPNEGHLLAAAMLREQAILDILTLNFDLALSSSLPQVEGLKRVGEIPGPEHHRQLRPHNLIYLHRNITYDPEDLILTTSALSDAWDDARWETRVAGRVVLAPNVVFVGLGSPSQVLVETARRIKEAVGEEQSIFFVDPDDPGSSDFFSALDLDEDQHIRAGWCDFMAALSKRVCDAYREELKTACDDLLNAAENWDSQDTDALASILTDLGLIRLGRVRARWVLNTKPYLTRNEVRAEHIADLLIALGVIAERGNSEAYIDFDGNVEFRREDGALVGRVGFASGEGVHRWHALDAAIRHLRRYGGQTKKPSVVVVSGVNGGRAPEPSPPTDLTGAGDEEMDANDIVTGADSYRLVTADEVHDSDADLAGIFE